MQLRFLACSLLSLSLASTSLIGCGVAEDAVDVVTEPKTATLHGTWKSNDGIDHPASIELEENGLSVSLTVRLEGHSCLSESTIEAKLTTSGVETRGDVAGMHLELSGSASLDELVGDFDAVDDGPCEKGWVNVFR